MQRVTIHHKTTQFPALPADIYKGRGLQIAIDGEFVIVKSFTLGTLGIYHAPRDARVEEIDEAEAGDADA